MLWVAQSLDIRLQRLKGRLHRFFLLKRLSNITHGNDSTDNVFQLVVKLFGELVTAIQGLINSAYDKMNLPVFIGNRGVV